VLCSVGNTVNGTLTHCQQSQIWYGCVILTFCINTKPFSRHVLLNPGCQMGFIFSDYFHDGRTLHVLEQ